MTRQRLFQLACGLILAALALAACSGSAESTTTLATTTSSTTTTSTPSPPTPPSPEPGVSTTIEDTTTTNTPSTDEAEYWAILDAERTYLIDGLSDYVQVDKLVFHPEDRLVELSVTSGFSTREFQVDVAWDLSTSFALTFHSDGNFSPEAHIARQTYNLWRSWGGPAIWIRVDADDVVVECSAEFVTAMSDRTVDRTDWERECVSTQPS